MGEVPEEGVGKATYPGGLSLRYAATKVEKHSLNSRMEQKTWLKANMKLLFLKCAGHAPGLAGVETAGWCELSVKSFLGHTCF